MANFPRVNNDNDWILGNIATGDDAILLDVKTAILDWQQDCWFDMSNGIDYYAILLQDNTTFLLQQQLTSVILSRQGVTQITNLITNIDNKNRIITINVTFKTIFNSELSFVVNNG